MVLIREVLLIFGFIDFRWLRFVRELNIYLEIVIGIVRYKWWFSVEVFFGVVDCLDGFCRVGRYSFVFEVVGKNSFV